MAVYDAFISYSHALDKPIAAALQTVVQRLGKPWYRRRSLRLFRDDTSLAASPHLWPSIEAALAQSRFLILLASPEAAASPWVSKEVAYWLEHKSIDTLLIALTGGELNWDMTSGDFRWSDSTPLPSVLRQRFPTEPRWVDVSAYRTSAAPRDVRFMDLGADFAAAIHGLPKEDLLSQEVRQQRRALTLAWSAAGSLLILASLAGWQWQAATAQRKRAENALTSAAATSDQLVYDLALKLRDRRGMPVDLVRDILGRVEGLQRQLAQGGETTRENRRLESIALGELSTTLSEQGDVAEALAAAERARAISEAFVKSDPSNTQYQRDLAVHTIKTGDAKVAAGQMAPALEDFQGALALTQRVAGADPGNSKLQRDLTIALSRIGAILAASGKHEQAIEPFRKTVAILDALLIKEPDNLIWQSDLSSAYNRIGLALAESGKSAEALEAYRKSLNIREELAKAEPNNTQRQQDVYLTHSRIGDLLVTTGQHADALPAYRSAQVAIERLTLSDPGNLRWQEELSIADDHVGDVLLGAGKADQALEQFQKGLTIREKLAGVYPDRAQWQHELAVSHDKVGDALLKGGRADAALTSYQSGLAIAQKLLGTAAQNPDWQRLVGTTLLKVGDAVVGTDPARAHAAYENALALRQKLVDGAPGNPALQHELALLDERLGNLHAAQGRPGPAAERLQHALAIHEHLAAVDPSNAAWQRELSLSYVRLAGLHSDQKETDAAVALSQKAVSLAEGQAAKAEDAWWSRQLAGNYEQLGSLLSAGGQHEQAIAIFRKAEALRTKFSAGEPDSVALQRELILTQSYLVMAMVGAGHASDALAIMRAALPRIEAYAGHTPENAQYQIELAQCLTWLATLGDDPRGHYERVLTILRPLAVRGALTPEQMVWIPNIEKEIAALPH